jgi:hypothetical protein
MKAATKEKLIAKIEMYARHFVKTENERTADRLHDTAMGYINAVEDIYGEGIAKTLENRFWKIALKG